MKATELFTTTRQTDIDCFRGKPVVYESRINGCFLLLQEILDLELDSINRLASRRPLVGGNLPKIFQFCGNLTLFTQISDTN